MRPSILLGLIVVLAGGVASAQLQPYSFDFTLQNTGAGVSDGRLRFAFDTLPSPGEEYFIDNVSLTCGGGSNIVINGDFNTLAQAPWKFFSNAVPSATVAFGTGEAVITFGPDGNNQQLYQRDLVLPAAGTECTLTFDACSTGGPDDPGYGHNMGVKLIKHAGGNVNYGLNLSGAPSNPEVDLLSCSAGPFCGDGIIDAGEGEECDDGGESEFCDTDCTPAECGDGTVNSASGEECDPGPVKGVSKNGPSCTSACLIDDGDCATSVCRLFWQRAATAVPEFCIPRFADNNNGTITDTATGLVWLKDASCSDIPGTDMDGRASFDDANAGAALLGNGMCGLTDGSVPGDWHLPSLEATSPFGLDDATGEFSTIFQPEPFCGAPFIPDAAGTGCWSEGDAFSGVQSGDYWSSTADAGDPTLAWNASLAGGFLITIPKTEVNFVWPVRSGP